MGGGALSVLLVEDCIEDALAMRRALGSATGLPTHLDHATRLADGLAQLARGGIDLVLLDLSLPDSDGLDTLRRVEDLSPDVPVIVTTGSGDASLAVEAVRQGAQDYLLKDELSPRLLEKAIRYAVERHRLLAEIRSLSLVDELTGLYNRRGFNEVGQQVLRTAVRERLGVLLLCIDLDDLKGIHDGQGHARGDEALRELAKTLRKSFRDSDVIARMGGDEFAVLALHVHTVDQVMARLQGALDHANQTDGRPYRLSISVGGATFDPGALRASLQELFEAADRAMYADKRSKSARITQPIRAPTR